MYPPAIACSIPATCERARSLHELASVLVLMANDAAAWGDGSVDKRTYDRMQESLFEPLTQGAITHWVIKPACKAIARFAGGNLTATAMATA